MGSPTDHYTVTGAELESPPMGGPMEDRERGASDPSRQPEMSKEEKEKLVDQVEEFEGPDRREIRGDNSEPADDPGVAHS